MFSLFEMRPKIALICVAFICRDISFFKRTWFMGNLVFVIMSNRECNTLQSVWP